MSNFINFKLNTNEGAMRTFLVNTSHIVHLSLLPLPGEYAAIDHSTGDQKPVRAVRMTVTMNQSTLLDDLVAEDVSDEIYRKMEIIISSDDGNMLASALVKDHAILKDFRILELPVLNELNQNQE